MSRPDWDTYFSELIQITAKRSTCKKLHVGCMLVKDNRIVAQGYNGFIAGCPHESYIRDGHEVGTVHAEQNAITDCAKRGVSCNDCTAYCGKLLLSAGIKNVVYLNDYNNDPLVQELFKRVNGNIRQKQLLDKIESDPFTNGFND
jgi:dCMP deaminase